MFMKCSEDVNCLVPSRPISFFLCWECKTGNHLSQDDDMIGFARHTAAIILELYTGNQINPKRSKYCRVV